LVEAGLHPATGGSGLQACSGDMLLEALVAFREIRLKFDLETDAPDEQRRKLLELTERYCVVMQTIRNATAVRLSERG
jgi:uncharacterized OsmC-like protein